MKNPRSRPSPSAPPQAVATITRLTRRTNARVQVDVDGEPWRTLPSTLVDGLELTTGTELTRAALRALRRQLRQFEAASQADRILSASDTSTANLAAALDRRGVPPADRKALIESLSGSGLLSDARSSQARASTLAERGYGNLAIEHKLEAEGYEARDRREAIEMLEPELMRAKDVLVRKQCRSGYGTRMLAQRGFDSDVCEALGDLYDAEI